VGPQEGEKALEGQSEVPPQLAVLEGVTEPCPAPRAGAGALVEATQAETTIVAPAPSAGETGVHPTGPGALGGPHGALSSQKKAVPRARYI